MPFMEISCISTGRLTRIVDKAMKDTIPQVDYSANIPQIKIKADTTFLIPGQTTAVKTKSRFIPAILYWQWEEDIKCDIGSKEIMKNFTSYLNYYADSTGLTKKLKNKTLYLTIQSLPKEFIYKYGYINLIIIVTYIDATAETISPQNADLKIEYSLYSGNSELKNGLIEYGTYMKDVDNNEWTSTKTFIRRYIYDYNEYLKQLARQVCIDLNKKI